MNMQSQPYEGGTDFLFPGPEGEKVSRGNFLGRRRVLRRSLRRTLDAGTPGGCFKIFFVEDGPGSKPWPSRLVESGMHFCLLCRSSSAVESPPTEKQTPRICFHVRMPSILNINGLGR
jgi:hypothetical protein